MTDIIKALKKQGWRIEEVNHPTYGKYIAWRPTNKKLRMHPIRTNDLETLKGKSGRPPKEEHETTSRTLPVDSNAIPRTRGKRKQSKGVEVRVQGQVRPVSGEVDLQRVLKGRRGGGRKQAVVR